MLRRTALALMTAGALPAAAEAALMIRITETPKVGVLASVTGTLNLTGLTDNGRVFGDKGLRGSRAFVGAGPLSAPTLRYLSGFKGPAVIGTGTSYNPATSGSGDQFLFFFNNIGDVGVPFDFVSGSAISSTATVANATFASLGLTTGTYTYSSAADTITVKIALAPPIPEPAAWALMIGGFGLAGSAMRYRQRVSVRLA